MSFVFSLFYVPTNIRNSRQNRSAQGKALGRGQIDFFRIFFRYCTTIGDNPKLTLSIEMEKKSNTENDTMTHHTLKPWLLTAVLAIASEPCLVRIERGESRLAAHHRANRTARQDARRHDRRLPSALIPRGAPLPIPIQNVNERKRLRRKRIFTTQPPFSLYSAWITSLNIARWSIGAIWQKWYSSLPASTSISSVWLLRATVRHTSGWR